jgi:HD-like signal output (HDOD) protein
MSINLQHNLAISDLLNGDSALASTPNIYFKLQETIDDPTKSLVDAAYIIQNDPALSIKLLKIVNSAFFGFPSKISSIDKAINLIGTKELQSIVLSTVVVDSFSDLPSDLISMHDFWAKSLRCALIAKGIDKLLGKEFSESIFICGILHNIGQLIFFRRIPELATEVNLLLHAQEDPTDLDEINFEEIIIGFDHYQTGAALTKLWKLPDIITKSIQLHAFPDNTEEFYKIASIIRLADSYSKMDLTFSDTEISHIDIPLDDMATIIDRAHQEFEEVFKFFYPN